MEYFIKKKYSFWVDMVWSRAGYQQSSHFCSLALMQWQLSWLLYIQAILQRWDQAFGNKSNRLFSSSLYLGERPKSYILLHLHKQVEWGLRRGRLKLEKMATLRAEPSLTVFVKRFKLGTPLSSPCHCRPLADVSGKNKQSQSQPKKFPFPLPSWLNSLRQNPNSSLPLVYIKSHDEDYLSLSVLGFFPLECFHTCDIHLKF